MRPVSVEIVEPCSVKARDFVAALHRLCLVHEVCIAPSYTDGLEIHNLKPSDDPLHFPYVEDKTNNA